MTFVDVILPLPLEGCFTYLLPASFEGSVSVGERVIVPFGKKKTYTAIVTRLHDDKPEGYEVKLILQVLDKTPVLLPNQYKLWQWIADYYLCPVGDVYKSALPSGMKSEDGFKPKTELYVRLAKPLRNERALHFALDQLSRAYKQHSLFVKYLEMSHYDTMEGTVCKADVAEITRDELMNTAHATLPAMKALVDRKYLETYQMEVGRLNDGGMPHLENINSLNDAQQNAYDSILESFKKHHVCLLHGVTSSGKTEIYIHLIERELKSNRQVLYLLPEIALTVQIMQRLQQVFGSRLGIYHSKYSDAERVEIWKKQLSDNPYDIILGVRSSVFLPFKKLGLVIIDEEHETSYKQQDPAPRYHARSVAIMLANMYDAKTLLGTATPSLESYHNAMSGKYGIVRLDSRYKNIQLPEIKVVDIKDLKHRKLMNGPFSPLLLNTIRETLAGGEQVILFQNRRGFAPMVECNVCGWVPHCANCDVSLTLHKGMNQLTCHYCGYTYRVPDVCPNCGSKHLKGRGFGTEKVEDQVLELFPEARVARMDLDTTRTRSAYERIIYDFSSGKTNLLIGTQMISKGLDFDNVSIVGILNADSMLNYPDFRAYEHAFMMMSQVSGRAGRKGKRGQVILQTNSPDLAVINQIVNNDFESFFCQQSEERRAFHYPPYYHLVYVYLKHSKENIVDTAGIELANRLKQVLPNRVLGPDKPPVAKVQRLFIRKIVLKLENTLSMQRVREMLRTVQTQMLADSRYGALQVYYDVDPL